MASRAIKTIFHFRKWMAAVEIILYIFMFLTLILTAYRHLFGGGH
ncbi:hypothetical protein [Thermovibrio ammonificans]|jgi:hypothetical protein|uniref:Uncharacterized protein n=1 Tax=Thermovibrio ammonificans (strain DSM 15698 / JCM 12110 / HB-1) TaxID=648996 RepID=E8T6F8_THEA1|nr:hypothetical protein [Thermovibrio ammonificans]ADU96742.1 hypothetical protein Theam_0775 [Thermovibrio ammonificans HB-1]